MDSGPQSRNRRRRSGLASADVVLADQDALSRSSTATEFKSALSLSSSTCGEFQSFTDYGDSTSPSNSPQSTTEAPSALPIFYVSDESSQNPPNEDTAPAQNISSAGLTFGGNTSAKSPPVVGTGGCEGLRDQDETYDAYCQKPRRGWENFSSRSNSRKSSLDRDGPLDQTDAKRRRSSVGLDPLFAKDHLNPGISPLITKDTFRPGTPSGNTRMNHLSGKDTIHSGTPTARFNPGMSPLLTKTTLHPGTSSSTPDPGMNLSFAGCGFLGIYHVGVSACLRKYSPDLLVQRIAGASAGALAAACLLCDADMGVITSSVLKTATEARARAFGPFSPTFNVEKLLREGLLTVLPANAHEIVSGRLFVSVTRVSDAKNVLLSQFDSREELVQALLCSSFIPGFSGYRPLKIKGVRYMDGGFTDNLPELDSATVTVSPFCGEADVCPKDRTAGLITVSLANTSIEISRENMQRFARILFPPPPETLSKMCQQGFNDALDFLQRNNLIACTRCVAVQSTVPLDQSPGAVAAKEHEERQRRDKMTAHQQRQKITQERDWTQLSLDSLDLDNLSDCFEEWETSCENCPDCKYRRQTAILDELPLSVGAVLQEAVDVADAGVAQWAAMSATSKIVSLLALPATYSLKLPFKVFKGLLSRLPSVPTVHGLRAFMSQVTELARAVLLSRRHAAVTELPAEAATLAHHHHHRRKDSFSCNVAITEFSVPGMEGRWDGQEVTHDPGASGYDSESEALNRLAQQYAQRSARSASVVPQGLTLPLSRGPSRPASRAPSRAPSRAVSRAVSRRTSVSMSRRNSVVEGALGGDAVYAALRHQHTTSDDDDSDWDAYSANGASFPPEDTFDRILNVTSDQDALMAYYYLDENNQMQVTEIFDMSEVVQGDTHDIYDQQQDDGHHHHHHHHHHRPHSLHHDQPDPHHRRRTVSGILRNSFSSTSGDNNSQQQQELTPDEEELLPKLEGQTEDQFSSEESGSDGEQQSDGEQLSGSDGEEHCKTSRHSLSSSTPSEPEADQHIRN